jgi:hypothetical protein
LISREAVFALVEEIWVNVEQGAERTGYNVDHIRRLARENMRLPEDERLMRVRKENRAYEIWLPDLINYVERRIPYTVDDLDLDSVEKIWVNTAEAAEYTGYNRGHLSLLGMQMWEKPESEREIKTKKRTSGYEMWLPDLVVYTHKIGRGPQKKRKIST